MEFNSTSLKIGKDVFTLSEMSAAKRRDMFKLFKEETGPIEVQAYAIQFCCDKFKDAEIDDIMEMPGTVFSKLAEEAMKISGLSDDAEAEAEKNS